MYTCSQKFRCTDMDVMGLLTALNCCCCFGVERITYILRRIQNNRVMVFAITLQQVFDPWVNMEFACSPYACVVFHTRLDCDMPMRSTGYSKLPLGVNGRSSLRWPCSGLILGLPCQLGLTSASQPSAIDKQYKDCLACLLELFSNGAQV